MALSCAADAVGLVARYDEGFGFKPGLARFESAAAPYAGVGRALPPRRVS